MSDITDSFLLHEMEIKSYLRRFFKSQQNIGDIAQEAGLPSSG